MKFEDGRTRHDRGRRCTIVDVQDRSPPRRAGPRELREQRRAGDRRRHPRRPTNISLRFGGVKALTDISFDVREHEIRAIIGPNGAGKSSMLNCINGVYQPQQGSITCAARPSAT